jgi:predicted SprT family Zn-dependent metalloprotease
MELTTARNLALKLMTEHGLIRNENGAADWTFRFDESTKRFGCCSYRDRTVSLSRALVALNSEARVVNTILHEIAHALLPSHVGHKPEWVRLARKIGCDGKRCYSSDSTVTVAMPITGTCPVCKRTVGRSRVPRRLLACSTCCKAGRRGFDARFIFVWTRTTSSTPKTHEHYTPFVAPTAPIITVPTLLPVTAPIAPTYYTPTLAVPTTAPTKYALWKARKLARLAA